MEIEKLRRSVSSKLDVRILHQHVPQCVPQGVIFPGELIPGRTASSSLGTQAFPVHVKFSVQRRLPRSFSSLSKAKQNRTGT